MRRDPGVASGGKDHGETIEGFRVPANYQVNGKIPIIGLDVLVC